MFKNSSDQYGSIAIIFHWLTGLAILVLFASGWYMVTLTYYDKMYTTLPIFHQHLGLITFLLYILRLIWKQINISPDLHQSKFEDFLSATIITLFYIIPIIIFASGLYILGSGGHSTEFFGFLRIGPFTQISDRLDLAGKLHWYLSLVLMGLVGMHVSRAFFHHFVLKNNTLNRMTSFKPLRKENENQ